jgi:hypothetical protein
MVASLRALVVEVAAIVSWILRTIVGAWIAVAVLGRTTTSKAAIRTTRLVRAADHAGG